jgi:hypothetical protein
MGIAAFILKAADFQAVLKLKTIKGGLYELLVRG